VGQFNVRQLPKSVYVVTLDGVAGASHICTQPGWPMHPSTHRRMVRQPVSVEHAKSAGQQLAVPDPGAAVMHGAHAG
jgi:hypothetical protein